MSKAPRVLQTTSRNPTNTMRTLCKDISCTFPNVERVNRGKLSIEGIIEKAIELNAEKVVIVDRFTEGTGKIQLFQVKQSGLVGVPPIIHVRNVKFRRGFGESMHKENRINSIAIANSSKESFEIKRLENALSSFFEVPVVPFEKAINGKCDAVMQVLENSSERITITFSLVPQLVEIGPRMEISHLAWELE